MKNIAWFLAGMSLSLIGCGDKIDEYYTERTQDAIVLKKSIGNPEHSLFFKPLSYGVDFYVKDKKLWNKFKEGELVKIDYIEKFELVNYGDRDHNGEDDIEKIHLAYEFVDAFRAEEKD